MDDLTPVTDPALIARLTASIEDDDDGPVRDLAAEHARADLANRFAQPGETVFDLPAGLYNPNNDEVVREVEVRELNGVDEEALAKIKNEGRMVNAILERATVRIGEHKASVSLLDDLLIGDRDAVLIGIRQATFGDDLELNVTCPHCQEKQKVDLLLSQDVPVKRHDDVSQRFLEIQGSKGMITAELPTGRTQKKLMSASDSGKSAAELNTILLAACVTDIDGEIMVNESAVRRLGLGDRAKVIDAIVAAAPGPQLSELSRTCVACSKEIELPLALSDLFRP